MESEVRKACVKRQLEDPTDFDSEEWNCRNNKKSKILTVVPGKATDLSDEVLDDVGPISSSSLSSCRQTDYLARVKELERLLQEKELKNAEFKQQLAEEKEEKFIRMKEVEGLTLRLVSILLEKDDKEADCQQEICKLQEELEHLLKEKERAKIREGIYKEVESNLMTTKGFLEKELIETKNKLNAREDVVSVFGDVMETELQCAICNELYVKATSLNCAHVFCKLCIGKWMSVKMECPNCRMAITSHRQAIALDSYIEKMAEMLSDDFKDRRKTLLEQRKEEQDRFDAQPRKRRQIRKPVERRRRVETLNRLATL